MKARSPSIEGLASAVFDNGRRGMPRPGCDCVQCFGYCMVDTDAAAREVSAKPVVVRGPRYKPLNFSE